MTDQNEGDTETPSEELTDYRSLLESEPEEGSAETSSETDTSKSDRDGAVSQGDQGQDGQGGQQDADKQNADKKVEQLGYKVGNLEKSLGEINQKIDQLGNQSAGQQAESTQQASEQAENAESTLSEIDNAIAQAESDDDLVSVNQLKGMRDAVKGELQSLRDELRQVNQRTQETERQRAQREAREQEQKDRDQFKQQHPNLDVEQVEQAAAAEINATGIDHKNMTDDQVMKLFNHFREKVASAMESRKESETSQGASSQESDQQGAGKPTKQFSRPGASAQQSRESNEPAEVSFEELLQ